MMRRTLQLLGLLALAAVVMAGGYPIFSTQPPQNRVFVYDSAGAEYTDATHSGVEIRAYVANAADTSDADSQFDLTELASGGWYPATIDTTVTVNIYRIDSAVDTLLESGFVFVGKFAPKGWVTNDAIEDDAISAEKISSLDGVVIQTTSITSSSYGTASVPATALQSNVALSNLLAGANAVDLAHSDGAGALPDSIDLRVDSLTVYQSFTVDNLITTDQPGPGSDGEVRLASAKFLALGDVDLTSTATEKVTIDGHVSIGDSLMIGVDGDTTTVHQIANGFVRHMDSITVTVPSLGTTAVVAFPGATADMTFAGEIIAGSGSTMATNQIVAKYHSPGHITWIATSLAGSSRTYRIYGRKF